MSKKNDPTPVIRVSTLVNDGCDWLAEVLRGGLSHLEAEIALQEAEERFLEAQQLLLEAAYTSEPAGTEIVEGQELVHYKKVVANRLALKAHEVLTWHIEEFLLAFQTKKCLADCVNKKWLRHLRLLLPEFCRQGFSMPTQRQERLVQTPAIQPRSSWLMRWAFGRDLSLPRQV